jgi:hypothetical protein
MTRLAKMTTLALLAAGAGAAPHYMADQKLALPDYRKWVFLGSGLGMSYNGGNPENPPFTNVYAEPEAYDGFMKTGLWPDKTVLVTEMVASAANLSINKSGRAQVGKPVDIEVEVKDAARGGWAFYGDFANGAQPGRLFPKSIPCYSCHKEHAATDNTFVQFYPRLIEVAKQHGTYKDR